MSGERQTADSAVGEMNRSLAGQMLRAMREDAAGAEPAGGQPPPGPQDDLRVALSLGVQNDLLNLQDEAGRAFRALTPQEWSAVGEVFSRALGHETHLALALVRKVCQCLTRHAEVSRTAEALAARYRDGRRGDGKG